MANKMLIDSTHPEETRVVVLRGNRVEEFDFESANRRQLRGNIYLAKVTRVEPSLQAAFIDYGGNRHGFLAFSEIHPDYYQIPVADRQALIEEEERASRRRGRGRPPRERCVVVARWAVVADAAAGATGQPPRSGPHAGRRERRGRERHEQEHDSAEAAEAEHGARPARRQPGHAAPEADRKPWPADAAPRRDHAVAARARPRPRPWLPNRAATPDHHDSPGGRRGARRSPPSTTEPTEHADSPDLAPEAGTNGHAHCRSRRER